MVRFTLVRQLSIFGMAATLAAGLLGSASPAWAQPSYAVVHSFTGAPSDGSTSWASLIQGADGTLYGTTLFGGSANRGTIFRMAADGSGYTVLHNFIGGVADGDLPIAGLIQGHDGTLFGTTAGGGASGSCFGCGTVFRIAPDGSGFTLLHIFGLEVSSPATGLIQDPDGTLYGTTSFSPGFGNCGAVFSLLPDGGGYTVIHRFACAPTDGNTPGGALVQGADRTLYGTTTYGGAVDSGTVFRMASDGSGFSLLHSFGGVSDGSHPSAGLILGDDGALYGTTMQGGSDNAGTIFKVAPDGTGYAIVHSFIFSRGGLARAGLVRGADGTLYGTTLLGGAGGGGAVYRIAPGGTDFTILHSFTDGPDGAFPVAGLIQDFHGTLYGTTSGGGTASKGVVFRLALAP